MSRRESLVVAGREAVQLLLGCIPMLFVAGIIETFVSPTDLAPKLKFVLAASLFTILCLYLSGFLSRASSSLAKKIRAGYAA
jgi:hypothetical protein